MEVREESQVRVGFTKRTTTCTCTTPPNAIKSRQLLRYQKPKSSNNHIVPSSKHTCFLCKASSFATPKHVPPVPEPR